MKKRDVYRDQRLYPPERSQQINEQKNDFLMLHLEELEKQNQTRHKVGSEREETKAEN